MHVRFTGFRGMPVADADTGEILGVVTGMLIQPDSGKIEGFFVQAKRFLGQQHLFLSSLDILHVGRTVAVRDPDVLAPVDDLVRIQSLLEDPRTFLGQRVRTESGVFLGRCADVQFDTAAFAIAWLFPRRWLRYGRPVPIAAVVEVRPEAIVVRDPGKASLEDTVKEEAPMLRPLPDLV